MPASGQDTAGEGGGFSAARALLVLRAKRALAPVLDVFLEAQAEGVRDRAGRAVAIEDGRADPASGIMLVAAGFLGESGAEGVRADLIYFRDGTPESPAECLGARIWRPDGGPDAASAYGTWTWARGAFGFHEDALVGPEIALYPAEDAAAAARDVCAALFAAVDPEASRAAREGAGAEGYALALRAAEQEVVGAVARLALLYGLDADAFLADVLARLCAPDPLED